MVEMPSLGCEYCDIANGAECPHSDERRATDAQIIGFISDRAADCLTWSAAFLSDETLGEERC